MLVSEATYSNSYTDTLMAAAVMHGADQHIRSSLRFSIFPNVTLACRPGESNQRPSDNKTLALPQTSTLDVPVVAANIVHRPLCLLNTNREVISFYTYSNVGGVEIVSAQYEADAH